MRPQEGGVAVGDACAAERAARGADRLGLGSMVQGVMLDIYDSLAGTVLSYPTSRAAGAARQERIEGAHKDLS